jgi:ABC-2 type transport system ATP-binding protein
MAITTENLTRHFGRVCAVDDLSLEIPAGIVFGFLGPNGAGKTTTIRLLLGLLEPTRGAATVLGFDTRTQSDEIRTRTGALLEHSGLYERLTAEDNLDFYGRVWRMARTERQGRIRELLDHLGLWDRRKELVRTWSRGMKQKLAVARALLHRPSMVFLDEPTAGLDPLAATALREDLAALVAREGITVFLTTHNLAEAEKLCSRVGVISRGKLQALGHPDDLRKGNGATPMEVMARGLTDEILARVQARDEVEQAEIRNSRLIIQLVEDADSAPLVALLVDQGVEIDEVRKGKASLEEAFLTLIREEGEA